MSQIAGLLTEAFRLHQSGQLLQAESYYRQVLQWEPNQSDALHLLGVLQSQLGRHNDAIAYIQLALAVRPDVAIFHNNLGFALQAQGRWEEAERHYRRAVELEPGYADAHNNLGNVLREQHKLEDALASFKQALRFKPAFPEAHNNLGTVFELLGKPADSERCCRQALHFRPDYAAAHNNLGVALQQQGRAPEALVCFEKALALKPDLVDACVNMGAAYQSQGRRSEAMANYRRALALDPQHAQANNNLGTLLIDENKHADAAAAFREALRQKPHYADGHANLGSCLATQGMTAEAEQHLHDALRLKPNNLTRIALAKLLPPIYQSIDEMTAWRRRLEDNVRRLKEEGVRHTLDTEMASPPFFLAYQGLNDRDLQRDLASLYSAPPAAPASTASGRLGRLIHVGFLSSFFKDHTIARLMRGLIAQLPRDKFSVTVFSIGNHSDAMGSWIRQHADNFVPVPFNLPAARDAVLQQKCDILLYTDIGMEPATYSLAFSRLAPVQCVTWGHPVTTGIPNIDYFISSDDLETETSLQCYTEKLICLKSPIDYYYRPQPPKLKSRDALGLPATGTLYVCPQSLFKFHAEFDAILGGILRQDPTGRLVLLRGMHPHWGKLLHQRFAATLPDVLERIQFLPPLGEADFLNLTALADVLLDPIHFGGGNTSYEAFSLGVPVVTMPSQMLRGRITLLQYRQMGVMDCVVANPEEYIRCAVRLGTDADYRADVSRKISAASGVLFENRAGVLELAEFFQRAVAGER